MPSKALPANRRAEVLRLSAPALLIACALIAPFIHKAYAIDDPYFLLQAQQVNRQFFRPLNFQICWFQPVTCGPANTLAPGAALMAYFLFPVVRFVSTEAVVHIMQLMLLLIAVMAAVSLALRLGATPFEARAAGMLLVTFPPVLAMTNTAMPDVLAMSLGVIGIERFMTWLDRGNAAAAIAAATALGLAPYARVHALGLIGVAAIAAVLQFSRHRRIGWLIRSVLPLVAAGALFAGISALTSERGTFAALPPAFNVGMRNVRRNSLSLFWYYLVCFPVAALWLVRMRRSALWLAVCSGVVFGILAVVLGGGGLLFSVRWSLAVLSVWCILHLLWRGMRDSSWETMLGVWLLVPVVAAPYMHLPPKTMMLCAPAAAIAGVILLRGETPVFRARFLSVVIAAFAVLSILILRADERFANLSRQASAELIAPHVKNGERVWFTGQWGLYWYAVQDGARIVVPSQLELVPGDLLLTETVDSRVVPLDGFPQRKLIASRVFSWKGDRVMSQRFGAGLYSNAWGPLPLSLGSGEVERFELWRID